MEYRVWSIGGVHAYPMQRLTKFVPLFNRASRHGSLGNLSANPASLWPTGQRVNGSTLYRFTPPTPIPCVFPLFFRTPFFLTNRPRVPSSDDSGQSDGVMVAQEILILLV